MGNYVDYKISMWVRIPIEHTDNIPAIIEKFKAGELPSGVDGELYAEDGSPEYDNMYDTEEYLTPSQNNGDATVEIFQNNKQVWNNQIIK